MLKIYISCILTCSVVLVILNVCLKSNSDVSKTMLKIRSSESAVGIHMNGENLRDGFQWLRKRHSFDAFVVDWNTNATIFEHLIFK